MMLSHNTKLQKNNCGQVLAVILSVSSSQTQQKLLFRYPCDSEQKAEEVKYSNTPTATVVNQQQQGRHVCLS